MLVHSELTLEHGGLTHSSPLDPHNRPDFIASERVLNINQKICKFACASRVCAALRQRACRASCHQSCRAVHAVRVSACMCSGHHPGEEARAGNLCATWIWGRAPVAQVGRCSHSLCARRQGGRHAHRSGIRHTWSLVNAFFRAAPTIRQYQFSTRDSKETRRFSAALRPLA